MDGIDKANGLIVLLAKGEFSLETDRDAHERLS